MQKSSTTATYTYAQVEAALARIYGAESVQRGAFRGRLKHFRKLGIPQRQPGKGRRLDYTTQGQSGKSNRSAAPDIFQMMLALELSEFGIDPHLIANILRPHWRRQTGLWLAIDNAQRFPGDDFHVAVEASFMSWKWTRKQSKRTATDISFSEADEPVRIHILKASDIKIRESNAFIDALKQTGRRFCIFNLSERVRAVEAALKSEE